MAKAEAMSLMTFSSRFPDEDACRAHLYQRRWPDGFRCASCQHDQYYALRTRSLFECRTCRHQTSLTAGTIMHKTKLPLRTWFRAIYLVAHDKRGRSALAISKLLEINYRTAWRLVHKIRRAMRQRDAHYELVGLVEMDDAYFGGPKPGTDGRGTTKTKVVISLGTDDAGHPRFMRMHVVDRISTAEIHRAADDVIAIGSTITSDGHNSYKRLSKYGYNHIAVDYYKADADFLKWLHIIIGNAKTFILGTYHGLPAKHLQAYLDEFCYRFNRRFFPDELFSRLLNACISAMPDPVPDQSA